MSGYSGTPLPKKLGISEGSRVAFRNAPEGFTETLGELPDGIEIKRIIRGPLDVIVAFFSRRAELEGRLSVLISAMDPAAGLWIAWPKKSSGVETDITGNVVRAVGLAAGLVDNKVCAIDETWSGLRFVIPVRKRAR